MNLVIWIAIVVVACIAGAWLLLGRGVFADAAAAIKAAKDNVGTAVTVALVATGAVVLAAWTLQYVAERALAGSSAAQLIADVLIAMAAIAIAVVISLPAIIGIVYDTAKNERQLTFVPTGDIKFIASGETITRVIVNVPGKAYDEKNDLIVDGAPPSGSAFVKRLLGRWGKGLGDNQAVFYVSIFYPLTRVLSWHFSWPKLEPKTHKEGVADGSVSVFDRNQIVQKESEVSSLFYQYPYPIFVPKIDLAGNFTINVTVRVILTVRKPVHLIGILKGKFMAQLTSEIAGMIDNGLRELDFWEWRGLDKNAKIQEILLGNKLVLNDAFEISEARYVDFDYVGNAKEVIEATVADRIEQEKGKARVTKKKADSEAAEWAAKEAVALAKGEADAIRARADASAFEIERTFGEAAKHPFGGEVLLAREQRAAVSEFGGSTLVLGNSRERVLVSADGKKPDASKDEAGAGKTEPAAAKPKEGGAS